jgi:hypothetical protein
VDVFEKEAADERVDSERDELLFLRKSRVREREKEKARGERGLVRAMNVMRGEEDVETKMLDAAVVEFCLTKVIHLL